MDKLSKQLKAYWRLMRFHKPIGILLLLWPTLWALWIAGNGHPDPYVVAIFVLGVIIMRPAGCIINDIADRHYDGRVSRTKDRPLATGEVSVKEALILFITLCLLGLLLVSLLNVMTIILATIALIVSSAYPYTKRFTHFPQLILGAGWYISLLMAFSALRDALPPVAWLLYGTVIIWTAAYDTMYAMADREEDIKIGLKSTAILLAGWDRAGVLFLQIMVLFLLVVIGWFLQLNGIYYGALAVAAGFMIYQQLLIRDRDPKKCLNAFLNNNWVGLAVFIGIVGAYYV